MRFAHKPFWLLSDGATLTFSALAMASAILKYKSVFRRKDEYITFILYV